MRSPYNYGFANDVSFSPQNRPGEELWRGGCTTCPPSAPSGPARAGLGAIKAVPSGTYMGPVGKIVLSGGGMRGYGYTSGPGIPDAVGAFQSPAMRAAGYLDKLGIATPGQKQALSLSGLRGRGLGSAQDRAMCQGITSGIAAAGTAARDINATEAGRDQGWNQAGSWTNALGQVANSMCNMIQTTQTPSTFTTAPPTQLYPPGYGMNPYAAQPQQGLPSWAIPAGIAAAIAVVGIGALVILK